MATGEPAGERVSEGADPIVVAGEALVDVVARRDGGLVGHPGGGPYNVARTIGRLEQPVAYLGRLSTDGFGARLRRELEADGVGIDTALETEAPTTLALVELDASGGASYRFYAAETSAPGLTLEAAAAVLPGQVGTFYLGTLGLVFEPLATTLERLVDRVQGDTLVALDPTAAPPRSRTGPPTAGASSASCAERICSRRATRTSSGSCPAAHPWTRLARCSPARTRSRS